MDKENVRYICVCVCVRVYVCVCVCEREREIFHTKAGVPNPPSSGRGAGLLNNPPP